MFVFCIGSLTCNLFARKTLCLCSVLGHWRGICLLVNPMFVFCLGSPGVAFVCSQTPMFCVLSWVTDVAFVCSKTHMFCVLSWITGVAFVCS